LPCSTSDSPWSITGDALIDRSDYPWSITGDALIDRSDYPL
jgi:hypothetical protein